MDIKTIKVCELCGKESAIDIDCDHPKNGYCGKYILQAMLDAKEVNMHDSIHTKAKK